MKKLSSILLLMTLISTTYAQISHGGKPLFSPLTRTYQERMFEEMPSFDLEKEVLVDALTESDLRGGYRFAYKFMTHLNRRNAGVSFLLPDGTTVWMLGIRSPGALSINVLFSEYELPEGAQVFLYNSSRTQVLGAFNHLNNSGAALLPVSPVWGDELIIEYQEPAGVSFPGRLTVGEVNHGYRSLKGYEPGDDRNEYACMGSPDCFGEDGEYALLGRSVVLLTIDGVTACTGVMVNNTLNDGKPYLLTASHCLNKDFSVKNPDYEAVAGRIICFFNYTSPTCDTLIRGTEEMSVASAIYRAVNEQSDMALLELSESPPAYYRPYYAGWTAEELGGTPPYAGIHHPRASVKRINIRAEGLTLKTFDIPQIDFYRNAHWNVARWDTGSTDLGSSGSPLFDSSHRLMGYLSGGRSTCNSPVDDYYAAFFKAWAPSDSATGQLRHWLNPSGSKQLTVDGLEPYADTPCYRLSNIAGMKLQDSIAVTELPPPAAGNLFGINSLQITEYAEEYQITGNAQLDGVYLVTPSLSDLSGSLDVEITVYKGNDHPQSLLHSEKFYPAYREMSSIDSSFIETGKRLNRAQESFVRFSQPVNVSGSFYIGYKIKVPAGSSFAVYNLPKGLTARNTAWLNNKGRWLSASAHPLTPFSTSLFIDPVLHYTGDSSAGAIGSDGVRVWVDAPRSRIQILLPQEETFTYRLYSVTGQL
ncbi:MAG: serine protease, partial [Tannerellaceae bacterium]|nr:serine protease [Tannerellaceae bacterium]